MRYEGMTWGLVPIKSLARSKSRLGGILTADERADLTKAMAKDVLGVLEAACEVDGLSILTAESWAKSLAHIKGFEVIAEDPGLTLSENLDHAARGLGSAGVKTVLIVPIDLPVLSCQDVDELVREHEDGLTLCRAARDGGTNALLCTPPDAIPFRYGPDSARFHQEEAEARRLTAVMKDEEKFARDIDLDADLAWLAGVACGPRTRAFLGREEIRKRLRSIDGEIVS